MKWITLVALVLSLNVLHAEGKKKTPKAPKTPVAEPATELTPVTPSPSPIAETPVATPTPAPVESPVASTPTATDPVKTASGYGKTEGFAGPVVIAPAITLVGFPTPFRFGLEMRGWEYVGLGFDYGFLPSLSFSNVKVKFNSWRITGRAFPFKGSFFLGVGFGKQNLTGTSSNSVSGTTVNYTVDIGTTIITPHVGWRWTWESGFFFGMELGVQLASSSTSTFNSDAPAAIQSNATYVSEKSNVEEQGRKLGKVTLPHFGLVQLGFYF